MRCNYKIKQKGVPLFAGDKFIFKKNSNENIYNTNIY